MVKMYVHGRRVRIRAKAFSVYFGRNPLGVNISFQLPFSWYTYSMKYLLLIPLFLLIAVFGINAEFTFAANDSDACTSKGATTMDANNQFKMVCNGFFWESCGFSPQPAGCTSGSGTSGGSTGGSVSTIAALEAQVVALTAQIQMLQAQLAAQRATGDRITLPVTAILGNGGVSNVACASMQLTGSVTGGYTVTCTPATSGSTSLTHVGFNPITGTGALGGGTNSSTWIAPNYLTGRGYCRSKDSIVDVPWPGSGGQTRPMTSGFVDETIAFRIVIPNKNPSTVASKWLFPQQLLVTSYASAVNPFLGYSPVGFVHIAEKPGHETTDHMISVSKRPCDFGQEGSANIIMKGGPGGSAPGINFGVWEKPGYTSPGDGVMMFHPGEVIYVNVSHDTKGYGTIPDPGQALPDITDRETCGPNAYGERKCDILFDFAIPGRGKGFSDVRSDGTEWPEDPAAPGWPLYSSAWNAAHPILACAITYNITGLNAGMSAANAPQHTDDRGRNVYSNCPGVSAIRAAIEEQRSATQ